ncbi:MAG: CDGSH iron-sulfur domain-containing protein [Flammeovirgaceae bacterium]
MDPEVPQKVPYVMEVEPGNYAWCSCGKSAKQPYCDGSHKGTEFVPVIEKVETTKKVAWCGCKHSNGAPFCDGSHNGLN